MWVGFYGVIHPLSIVLDGYCEPNHSILALHLMRCEFKNLIFNTLIGN